MRKTEECFSSKKTELTSRVERPKSLRDLIDGIDLPLAEIAKRIGICERTLRAIRNGTYTPRRRSKIRLCVALGLSLEKLDSLIEHPDRNGDAERPVRRATLFRR